MARQSQKKLAQQQKINDDIKFLLSNIRARENGLIFFLQRFTEDSIVKTRSELYQIYKQEFIQKQKIYTNQIMEIVEKLSSDQVSKEIQHLSQIKSFWLKLKSILKVTLERANILGLTTNNLASKYEQILGIINEAQQKSYQIKQFVKVEKLIKKRTIEALIATKSVLCQNILAHSRKDQNKNRSQTFLKINSKPIQSINFSPLHFKDDQDLQKIGQSTEVKALNKLKSMTRVRKKQSKVKGKGSVNNLKRTQSALIRYENSLASVMEFKNDFKIDKQKPKQQQENHLYDVLFDRNIANHKKIIKYIHSVNRLSSFMKKIKQNSQKPRQIQTQKRYNKGAREFKDIRQLKELIKNQTRDDIMNKKQKGKLMRPKTSKQRKVLIPKLSNTKQIRNTQVLYA